ncbi:BtpA/SgcQ family protein [Streptomyces nigra]|uniref:BtpA/SgcQ family protein n=1 Tax=Streptomyces nigra TaxID=1827580 RepID=UPI0036C6E26A
MLSLPDKAVIACVHLPPTPGSPGYQGKIDDIYTSALTDAEIFLRHGVDALIVENFRDAPFHPGPVPAETTATIAAVTREIVRMSPVATGVAVLRNDASAALAIATATGAAFIRVNVHVGAVLSEQGIVTGNSHETLRLRRTLQSDVAILADARVKHSQPLAYTNLASEVRDLSQRADGIIVSGELTGLETSPQDLLTARKAGTGPLFVGSGVTPHNLPAVYEHADGFIVGSYCKTDGVPGNPVDESRVDHLMAAMRALRENRHP